MMLLDSSTLLGSSLEKGRCIARTHHLRVDGGKSPTRGRGLIVGLASPLAGGAREEPTESCSLCN